MTMRSWFCSSEPGVTYEQALANTYPRDVGEWYESVAAIDAVDDRVGAMVSPSDMAFADVDEYFDEEEETVHYKVKAPQVNTAILEDAVLQLKAEVRKLELKKKKKSAKASGVGKENQAHYAKKQPQPTPKVRDVVVESSVDGPPLKAIL